MNPFIFLACTVFTVWIVVILYEKWTLDYKLKRRTEQYEKLREHFYKMQHDYVELMAEHSRYMAEKEPYSNIVDN